MAAFNSLFLCTKLASIIHFHSEIDLCFVINSLNDKYRYLQFGVDSFDSIYGHGNTGVAQS